MYSRNIDDIETILKETKPFDGETKAEIFHKAISNFLINIVVIQVGIYHFLYHVTNWDVKSSGIETYPDIEVSP